MHADLFRRGYEAFNAGRYFDAHEFFEAIWKALPEGDEKSLYQGIIQLAVALHHQKNDNATGFHNVLERACDHFASFRKSGTLPEGSLLGMIDVDDLIAQAALLAMEPEDNSLPAIKIKTKTPGR